MSMIRIDHQPDYDQTSWIFHLTFKNKILTDENSESHTNVGAAIAD